MDSLTLEAVHVVVAEVERDPESDFAADVRSRTVVAAARDGDPRAVATLAAIGVAVDVVTGNPRFVRH